MLRSFDEFDYDELAVDNRTGQGVFDFDPTDLAKGWSYENNDSVDNVYDDLDDMYEDISDDLSVIESENENLAT
ncbi:4716_t:CDS:1, partial [Scutellospora calospora]